MIQTQEINFAEAYRVDFRYLDPKPATLISQDDQSMQKLRLLRCGTILAQSSEQAMGFLQQSLAENFSHRHWQRVDRCGGYLGFTSTKDSFTLEARCYSVPSDLEQPLILLK